MFSVWRVVHQTLITMQMLIIPWFHFHSASASHKTLSVDLKPSFHNFFLFNLDCGQYVHVSASQAPPPPALPNPTAILNSGNQPSLGCTNAPQLPKNTSK